VPTPPTQASAPVAGKLLLIADLAGTLLFGIEGAVAAVQGNLDLLGIMVLAFATALVGGILRDLLLGATPPASLRDWRYPAAALLGGLIVISLYDFVLVIPPHILLVMDAAALALFAVAGTQKALLYKMHPSIAVLLGGLTAVGGGTLRDILLAQVPRVLNADIYATAALFGALVLVIARKLRVPSTAAAILGGVACFSLRLLSLWLHWNLPRVVAH
jgi:uncharacterized membrane protein YeiH